MGVSIYPVLNKNVPGFNGTEMFGKALAAAAYEPNSAFAVLQCYHSMNEEYLRGFVADQTGQAPETIQVPPEKWFAPEEGLQNIHFLLPLVVEADTFADALREDLRNLEKALLLAQEQGALFHLAMDF